MKYLIDTNLLILLIAGSLRADFIGIHWGMKDLKKSDYEKLREIVENGKEIVLSPYILSELTSLAVKRISEPLRAEVRLAIRFLIEQNTEKHIAGSVAAARNEYLWLGLA